MMHKSVSSGSLILLWCQLCHLISIQPLDSTNMTGISKSISISVQQSRDNFSPSYLTQTWSVTIYIHIYVFGVCLDPKYYYTQYLF